MTMLFQKCNSVFAQSLKSKVRCKMGTPLQQLRRFLSPQHVSSIVQYTRSKSPTAASGRYLNVPKKPEFVRRLEFKSPAKYDTGIKTVNDNLSRPVKIFAEYEKLQNELKTCSDKVPIVDTPHRKTILENGLGYNCLLLGKGRFGTVVKGMYKGKTVAVKVIHTKSTAMSNEENAIKLKHKNIVNVLDVIWNPDSLQYGIVIMEYMNEARNLQMILDDINDVHPLAITKVAKFAMDICKGLQYCHDNGIVHLDIKPKNVLVTWYGKSKICDFGSSWRIGNTRNKYYFQGTICYAAPELLRGQMPTLKSDIYSLGITYWQIIEHKTPFQNFDNNEVKLYQIVSKRLRPTSSPGVSQPFKSLYESCWLENPGDRPDIAKVMEKLSKIND